MTPLLRRGDSGADVVRLQRMLSDGGFFLVADGIFGPATEAALRAFQVEQRLCVDGIAGPQTWRALFRTGTDPRIEARRQVALTSEKGGGKGIPSLTLRIALDELAEGAGEVGGNNRGPWVHKYMGVEGLPWCVGFATWCYRQACARLSLAPALRERYSSSRLAAEADAKGWLRPAPNEGQGGVVPGHLFIVRGGPTGFRHTGIVRELGANFIRTVEGNSKQPGESGPDCVLSRHRGLSRLVFVALPLELPPNPR